MKTVRKSNKLSNVCYDIRGPILKEAHRLEEEGYDIIKLNIGNPAAFDLHAPDELLHDLILNLPKAQGYSDSKGIFSARKAVMQYFQKRRIFSVTVDDVYIGNGVSELIVMAMQALLNNNDEVLLPAPDYPLWTAAVNLSGGKPVHYLCDEKSDWNPDIRDMEKKITKKTKAIVVINPNNPTGAVYDRSVLEKIVKIAQKHGLIIYSDEIYDRIVYDGAEFVPMSSLADDLLIISFGGISKNYRAAGFRAGWMVLAGNKKFAKDYIEGLEILASMRLCSNVPAQYTIQTSLGGYQTIDDLVAPGGRLREQRDIAWKMINSIPGLSCVKPKGALYVFPKIDTKKIRVKNDYDFALNMLRQEKVLTVQGTGFNWPKPDHFRVVFLPRDEVLKEAVKRIRRFCRNWKK